ncbi:MAG: zf-HC2 domain-containing protein [bacterium]|nr:zf-HC2 domain-containing protein [bacterium]
MDHSYFRDKVSAYHDRELPAQEQEMLEQHVASCPECQKLLADLERLDQLVADKLELGESDYWEQNAQKIEERLGFAQKTVVTPITTSRWDKGLVWKLSAVAASVSILVFIGINKDDILKDTDTLQNVDPNRLALPKDTTAATSLREQLGISEDSVSPPTGKIAPKVELKSVESKPAITDQVRTKTKDKEEAQSGRDESDLDDSKSRAVPVQRSAVIQKTAPPSPQTESKEMEPAKSAVSEKIDIGMDELRTNEREVVATSDGFAAGSSGDLAHWRSVRDSMVTIVEKPKESMMSKYGVTKLKTDARKQAAAASAPTAKEVADSRARYLEACYQIAMLTDTPTEYTESKGILEAESKSTDSITASIARDFLNRLSANRPYPPQK